MALKKAGASMKYHKDSILCRLHYAEENGELYEGEIKEEYAGRTNYFNVNPDPRIEGYGKMTYSDGKVVMGYWSRGKALRYITIRPNGKRDFVCLNLEDEDSFTYNQVYFTADHKFIPGGHKKKNTNNWSEDMLNDIVKIETIIAAQQEYLKDIPVLTTKMGDGWCMDTMVSTLLKSLLPHNPEAAKARRASVSIKRIETKPDGEFSVVLEKVGQQPNATVKVLRETVGLGLADAKKMTDRVPVTVMSGLDYKNALMLKDQLEAIGNVVSVPGMETEEPVNGKNTVAKPPAKKTKSKKGTPSELETALVKVCEYVGKDGFANGERVCNLLSDLVPKLEKERRRIKIAYSANAVSVLINEADKTFAVSEAVKRIVDYSDMAESVAMETVLVLYEVLK